MKDEITGNPRWGQIVIDKVRLKKFVPVLAFRKRFEVCFVIFKVNEYILYFIHLTFCADKVKKFEIKYSYHATKNRHRKSKVFCMYGIVALRSPIPTF